MRTAHLVIFSLLLLLLRPAVAADDDALRIQATTLFGVLVPVTEAEINDPVVELGRALFWDTSLSSSGDVACASCHLVANMGADSRRVSRDARGRPTRRHSQTVFNAQAATAGLRWLGDRASGTAQALGSITGSMGFANREDIIPLLMMGSYPRLFRQAFPAAEEPVTAENYGLALETYQRSLRTPAAFDQWLNGVDTALNADAKMGLQHFIRLGCVDCHNGPLLGGTSLQRFGVLEDFRVHTGSDPEDVGLMTQSANAADRDVFRVQPLRNVANTAPYFHDGSVSDLGTAVRIMATVQLGRNMQAQELAELLSFLQSLSGAVPRNFSAP